MDVQLINSSDSVITSTVYDSDMVDARGYSATYLEVGSAGRDDFALLYHDTAANNAHANMTMWIFNPFQSDSYTFQVQQSSGYARDGASAIVPMFHKGIGLLRQQSSITGYSFVNRNSLNIATGTFRTYGLKVD